MTQRGAGDVPGRRPMDGAPGPSRLSVWVPAVYAVFSAGWIATSDAFLAAVEPSVRDLAWWSTAKGLGFVLVTTLALHAGLRWATARERRIEWALRRAERRYDLLAEHARDVILFIRREDGRILDANAAAAAAYGWSLDELRARTIHDLRAPAWPPLTAAQLAQADAGGFRFELEHRRKDGTTFPVEVITQGTQLDGERVYVSVVRDATERRATEEAFRESEERLALAIEAAGLGTFHALPYGRMEWSPRCREIFGTADGAIRDFEAFLALVHPDDRDAVRAAAEHWTDPGGDGRYQQQYRIVRPDRTVRWVSAHGIARFADVEGVRRPVRLAGTILDVTDVKAVQAQLMQSDRLASVGMLAAGVAHEINNPLAYLSAALDFLHEHARRATGGGAAPDAEVLQALADAREGAERVRLVVRDLRTFSGTREERRARVELERVVESAIHLALNEIRYRARLVREYGPAPAVTADEGRLGQVVLNLLINAAQAIPDGRAADHEIRVVTRTDAGGRAVLEVQDTGIGIPPEIGDRIFDPFFTTKPTGVGTGLGLAICRGIVLALGGEIVAEGRPGGGTTMRVVLPPAPPAPAAAPPPTPAPAGRRGRVLVVDDEAAVGAAVRRVLAAQHDVEVRTSAEDALDAIRGGERFDVILCDLMMPRMTGMELHAALARLAPDQASRMVVFTGGAFTAGAREFLDRVPLPRCEKPFDVARLRAIVRRVVG